MNYLINRMVVNRLLVLFILISNIAFGQDAKYELKMNKRELIGFVRVADDGTSVLNVRTAIDKNEKYHIMRFDNSLNMVYNIEVKAPKDLDLISGMYLFELRTVFSKNGKNLLVGDALIDEKGKVKPYNIYDKYGTPKTGNVEPFFSVFGNEYLAFVGRKKGRKGYKKIYKQGDLLLFTKKHLDYSEKTVELEFPKLSFGEKDAKMVISGKESFDNSFYLIATKDMKRIRNSKIYYVLNYAFNGKLLSSTRIQIKLNKAFITISNRGWVQLVIDHKNKEYYFYGAYSTKKQKRLFLRSAYKGFFIAKYDINGKLIWNKQIPINDKDFRKPKEPTFCDIEGVEYGDNIKIDILDYDYTKKNWLFFIDKKTGKINSKFTFKHKKKTSWASMHLNTRVLGVKEYKKYYFDNTTFSLMHYNPKFNKYIKSLPNTKLYYKGYDLKSGKTLIHQYDIKKNKFSFLIF